MDADGMKAGDKRFIHRSSVTGEIVSKEYALANPDTTEKEQVCGNDNRGRFRKVADELLDKYERGYRMEHLGELMVWLVNGPTEG